MSAALKLMIGLMGKIFGNEFWNNVVLEATHWRYDIPGIGRREEADMNEIRWTGEFNSLFNKEYGVQHHVPSVFIDTFYNKSNPFETHKFKEGVDRLMNFSRFLFSFYGDVGSCNSLKVIIQTEINLSFFQDCEGISVQRH